MLSSIGKWSWIDGNIFEGEWKDDKRYGQGKKNLLIYSHII